MVPLHSQLEQIRNHPEDTLLGVSVRMFPGSLTETGRHALNVGSTIPRGAVPD